MYYYMFRTFLNDDVFPGHVLLETRLLIHGKKLRHVILFFLEIFLKILDLFSLEWQ
jgi:hypothetical protein